MLRKWNRILAFLLAIALVTTTFGSDFASAKVYAEGTEEAGEGDDSPSLEGSGTGEAAPESGNPGNGEPGDGEPGDGEPGDGEPGDGNPGDGEPGDGNPGDGNPGDGNPGDGNPGDTPADDEIPVDGVRYDENGNPIIDEIVPEEQNADGEMARRAIPEDGENKITINYAVTAGGSVSTSSEEITVVEGEDPVATGSTAKLEDEDYSWVGWSNGETIICSAWSFTPSGDQIFDGATYTATFKKSAFTVTYKVDGSTYITQGYNKGGSLSLPEAPFKAGYFFTGWKNGDEVVGDGYEVNEDLVLNAEFQQIEIYEVKIIYYYNNKTSGVKTPFETVVVEAERTKLPKTVESPSSTEVQGDPEVPVYYPSQSSVTIDENSIQPDNIKETRHEGSVVIGVLDDIEIEYVPFDIGYYVTYMLKDLTGDGYTEVAREEHRGVQGTNVTPEVKSIKGGIYESAESVVLTGEGQEVPVYYNRAQYTLHYDTVGGNYIDAVVEPYETEITLATTVVHTGYDFAGWYLDAEYETPAPEILKLEQDTTVYAKWEPKMVDYTIVCLIENANDTDYSFKASAIAQARVGSEVTLTDATVPQSIKSKLDLNNFTFKESSTETIRADGTTVVTVKYSRNVYTIKWDGKYHYVNANGSWKELSNQGSAQISAKYGADIATIWNATFNDGLSNKYAWNFRTGTGSAEKNNDKFVTLDKMPSREGKDYSGNTIKVTAYYFATDNTQTLNYWLEGYDTEKGSMTHNGKSYGLFDAVTVRFNYLYENSENPVMPGYTKAGYTSQKKKSGQWVDAHYSWGDATSDYNQLIMNMFYDAESYPLTFFDYDGKKIVELSVKLNADISGYMDQYKPKAPVSDAEWLGWCTDSKHTAEYNGDQKMPTGLSLYANWKMPKRTITFADPFSEPATTIKTVEYDYGVNAESILPAENLHEGYDFSGWYVDDSYSKLYDFAKPLTENISVYAKWNQKIIGYTVKYVDEDGNDVAASKYMESPVYTEGYVVTEKALSVLGMIPDAKVRTLALTTGTNEIIFVYSPKNEKIRYTVRYVHVNDDGSETEVAPSVLKEKDGDSISVTEAAIDVPGYFPVENIIEHDFVQGKNVITFHYNPYKTGKVTVIYVDMDGQAVPGVEEQVITGKVGSLVNISVNDVSGYTYKKITDEAGNETNKKVTLTESDIVRKIYLQKNLTITAQNLSKPYDGTPLKSVGIGSDVVKVEGLVNGHTLSSIEYDGSQIYGGTSPTTPKNAVIAGPNSQDYYKITYVSGNLTVTKASVIINITGEELTDTYSGEDYTIGYSVEILPQNSAFSREYLNEPQVKTLSEKNAGEYPFVLNGRFSVKDEYADSFDYTINVVNGKLTIKPKRLDIYTESITVPYGQVAEIHEGHIDGLVPGDIGHINLGEFNARRTEVIEIIDGVETTFTWNTINGPVADEGYSLSNYTYESADCWHTGKLVVEPLDVTVTVKGKKPDAIKYDGQPHTVFGFTLEADNELYDTTADYVVQPAQDTIFVTETEVGKYTQYVESHINEFSNTSTNFNVRFVPENGELNIIKSDEVVVYIQGDKPDEVPYDGQSHKAEGYEVTRIDTPQGVAEFKEEYITFSGNALVEKIDAGTYPMGLDAEQFGTNNDNYTVRFIVEDGELKIGKVDIRVDIYGDIKTVPYDRTEQKAEGYETKIYLVGKDGSETETTLYTDSDYSFNGVDVVLGTNVSVYDMSLATGDFTDNGGENSNYNVIFNIAQQGRLEITKRKVEVTVVGNSLPEEGQKIIYDGQSHSVNGYEITSIQDVLTAEDGSEIRQASTVYTENDFDKPYQDAAVATATRTIVGETFMDLSANSFVNGDTENFDVTFDVTPGSITISKVTDKYTVYVHGNTDTKPYIQNQEQYVEGFTVTDSESEGGNAVDSSVTVELKPGKEAKASGTDANEGDDKYMMNLKPGDFTATSENYEDIEIVVVDGWLKITPAKRPDNTLPTVEGYEGVYDADSHTITITGGLEGDEYTFSYDNTVDSDEQPSATNVNESISGIIVTVNNPNYEPADCKPVDITITARKIKVKTGDAEQQYNGQPLTNETAEITGVEGDSKSGLVDGEVVTVKASGSQTEVNVDKNGNVTNPNNNTYQESDIDWGDVEKTNYELVDPELGTLKVTPNTVAVVLTAPSASKMYDGTALEANEGVTYNKSLLPAGYKIKASAAPETELINVGTTNNIVSVYQVVTDDDKETDVTSAFTGITTVPGTLEITPAEISVTTDSDSKPYDGEPLVAGGTVVAKNDKDETTSTLTTDNYDADNDVFSGEITLINGETATLVITGRQIEVGGEQNNNTYKLSWDGSASPSNYTIKNETKGTLTVTEFAGSVVVTVTGGSYEYDGTDHKPEITVVVPSGYDYVAEAAADSVAHDVTGAEGIPAKLNHDTFKVTNAGGKDITQELIAQNKVTFNEDDTLVVRPATLKIVTPSASKPFDGTALTAKGTISGFVKVDGVEETATFKTTGSATYPADVYDKNNTYSLVWDGTADEGNYTLEEDLGTLTITKSDATVEITAPSKSQKYNGEALTFEGTEFRVDSTQTTFSDDELKVTGLPTGEGVPVFTVVATTKGSVTHVADADKTNKVALYDIYIGTERVTDLFDAPKTHNGTLTIEPAPLTIKTPTASKKYDGTPLTAEGTIEGFVNDETATFETTGNVTYPDEGAVSNSYKLTWNGTAAETDYTLDENLGTLTVNDRIGGDKFKIIAIPVSAGSIVYDGKVHDDFDYTLQWDVDGISEADIAVEEPAMAEPNIARRIMRAIGNGIEKFADSISNLFGFVVTAKEKATEYPADEYGRSFSAVVDAEVIADREAKNVGDYILTMDEATLENYTVIDGTGKDVTDQFELVAGEAADFEITPAPVTITAQNASKTVGGAEPALTAVVKADNSDLDAEAQSIAYDIARESGEAVGTYAIIPTAVDGIKTEDGKFIQGNFLVTYVNGIFTISSAPTPPTPSGGDPTPTPGGGGTTIPDAPAPLAATPAGGVLGATREEATNGAAVLGARRGRTEDDANRAARVFAIVVAATAALTMLLTGKKKEEEEK